MVDPARPRGSCGCLTPVLARRLNPPICGDRGDVEFPQTRGNLKPEAVLTEIQQGKGEQK